MWKKKDKVVAKWKLIYHALFKDHHSHGFIINLKKQQLIYQQPKLRLQSTNRKPAKCTHSPIVYVSNYSWHSNSNYCGSAQTCVPNSPEKKMKRGAIWTLKSLGGLMFVCVRIIYSCRFMVCLYKVGSTWGTTIYVDTSLLCSMAQ